jgi:hypothetical protein
VRALTPAPVAEWIRQMHPLRLQYELMSDASPLAASIEQMARQVRDQRQPAQANNPFMAMERGVSGQIVAALDAWRDWHDHWAEWMFLSIYGSPWLQAAAGIGPADSGARKAGKNPLHAALVDARIAELKSHIAKGGLRECVVRAMIYTGMPRGGVDERGVQALRRMQVTPAGTQRLTLSEFKSMVREQYFMLLIDPEGALAAVASMLPSDMEARRKGLAVVQQVLSAAGEITGEVARRLGRITQLFGLETGPAIAPTVTELPRAKKTERTQAS